MRYFKVEITYELEPMEVGAKEMNQVLYCCSPNDFPKDEELRELFYSLDGHNKKYLKAFWKQVREEEIHTDEIHLI